MLSVLSYSKKRRQKNVGNHHKAHFVHGKVSSVSRFFDPRKAEQTGLMMWHHKVTFCDPVKKSEHFCYTVYH